ncbi:hypothetical protein A2803_01365 [Candidatus Woesebacteria bacterium RIFCSPHIGHO2_01_FULL_44_21]|uniref:Uncharacterized protein n=1 Tax=Candidatus Woesebacteria bacterium RIFCSPHIGHO2_01_FULL_44_21 TaxID=1802503 RepID=A0A1F7Z0R1_9BACT|nr:MAG: hypothetical protein A2803_01365 [Candidatus Woesebacteria bacterium RIFCSPHIGHO2_01_FULL_44_21]OGM70839.1 MAG: hypothetical protein A2897_05355 [Candidatus Woesebacteria bacterium RIFCSPLOWO2_01_FULL_44_24b]
MDTQQSNHQPTTLGLSPHAIAEFQKIYLAEFKEPISPESASLLGMKLLRLFKRIYKPISKKEDSNDGTK